MARISLSIIGIIIMAFVLIASAGGYIYTTKTQTTTNQYQSNISSLESRLATDHAEQACLPTTPVPQRPVGNLTPVLTMKPGTTGTICVTYKTSWGGNASIYTNYTASQANHYWFGIWIGRNNSVSHSFAISMQPNPVTPSPTLNSITVLYQVTALANSTGFYDYSAPYGYCGTMPMAVGYSGSKINGSDFPPRPQPHSCPAEPYIPASVGISGLSYALVNIPASRSYMTAPTATSYCSEGTPTYTGNAPCFTHDRSQAYIFNCLKAASTPSGCVATFGTGPNSFNVTVWYPVKNQTVWWANCYYVVANASGKTHATQEVCLPLTSSSFIVATVPDPLT